MVARSDGFKFFVGLALILVIGIIYLTIHQGRNNNADKNVSVVTGNLGPHFLFVPYAYLHPLSKSIGPESILLQTFYPGDAVVPGKPEGLWKKGEWWKNVRVLGTYHPNSKITFNDLTLVMIKHHKATEIVGEEYGLVHQKQPLGEVQDKWDMWLEREEDKYVSYITCSEKIIETDVPQCSQRLQLVPKLTLEISYDKRLLPHWRTIEYAVISMFNSFKSKEEAHTFFLKRISEKDEDLGASSP